MSGISILSSVFNHLAARFHFTRSAYARFSSLALLSSSQFGKRNLWRFGYYSRSVFRMSTCLLTINPEEENIYTSHPLLQNNNRARRNSRNQVILDGPSSSVGTATGYGLDGPGIESRWGRDFPHLSRPAMGPTQPPVQ